MNVISAHQTRTLMETLAPTIRTNHKEIRTLNVTEVCGIGEWLDKYMRLELVQPRLTDGKQLMHVLGRSSREYEGDLGVFGMSDE